MLKFKPSDIDRLEAEIDEAVGDEYLTEEAMGLLVEFIYRHLNDEDSSHFLHWRYTNGSW